MHMRRLFFLFAFLLLMAVPARALDVEVKVSSFKFDIGLPYAPENLLDGDVATAWVGGGVGGGSGQWIELSFAIPTRVQRIGIFNGHQGEGQYEKHRRIRSGRIVYPDGKEIRFWLRDEPGEQVVECGGRPAKSLRIVVDEVFPKGDLTSKTKLAVSELKLYLSLMANPDDVASGNVDTEPEQAMPPVDPDAIVPEEITSLLKEFYVRQTSLADNYAELFAEDVRDRNDLRFLQFQEIMRQRGTYKILRTAKVNTEGLGFELIEQDGSYARVRVFGAYRVQVGNVDRSFEDDSTYVVRKTDDGWKIVELEGEEDLF
ncbi:discoidin domain-containing protein [Pseudodesulfovibrio sp. zrk46]|uniref:discoidin domain-containing protein n=1 Tax=Pseudodesulfovibrio sp. zrk46 TaxID=2725288 RepID=UPI001449AC94|nr:discoidin domain-containing protein [Pseudodesulfovibrio sp. zrk46]QJB56983.1 discoidin domain-containing protein [Pseudodesulfovibrio sp. zrk46]